VRIRLLKIINYYFLCQYFKKEIHCYFLFLACDNVLSFICQWYIKMFAHIQTNDYIFETIHSNLEKLPWQRFIPTPIDLDLIMKVIVDFVNLVDF